MVHIKAHISSTHHSQNTRPPNSTVNELRNKRKKHVHAVEYNLLMKRSKALIHTTAWRKLEIRCKRQILNDGTFEKPGTSRLIKTGCRIVSGRLGGGEMRDCLMGTRVSASSKGKVREIDCDSGAHTLAFTFSVKPHFSLMGPLMPATQGPSEL